MKRFAGVILVMLVFSASLSLAQANQEIRYTADDNSVMLEYPGAWSLAVDERHGFLYLSDDDLNLTLYTPAVLDDYLIGNIVDPSILVGLIMAVNDLTEISLEETLVDGRPAAVYSYRNDAEANSGLLTAIQFRDGTLGLVDAYRLGGDIHPFRDDILAIVATFDLPPTPAPLVLVSHDGRWQDVIAELAASELTAPGGDLVFIQPSAFTAGTGQRFQGLAQSAVHQNVVVAGTLSYSPSAAPQGERCGLALRYVDENRYLTTGQQGDGSVFVREADSDGGRELAVTEADSGQRRYVLLALEQRLIVYVDGELVFDDVQVMERAGSYGIMLESNGPARCEVSNMWAYVLPVSAEPGVCEISAGGAVNKRSGPGTNFDLAGQLAANTAEMATGQTTGADGLRWWQLADATWVREDVVQARGDCAALPLVE